MPNETNERESCGCADPDLNELRRLITAGVDQRQASHLLWGDQSRIGNDLAVEHAGRRAVALVRAEMRAAFPWLRLPPLRPTTGVA